MVASSRPSNSNLLAALNTMAHKRVYPNKRRGLGGDGHNASLLLGWADAIVGSGRNGF